MAPVILPARDDSRDERKEREEGSREALKTCRELDLSEVYDFLV